MIHQKSIFSLLTTKESGSNIWGQFPQLKKIILHYFSKGFSKDRDKEQVISILHPTLWVKPCRTPEIKKTALWLPFFWQFIYFRQNYLKSVSLLFDIWVRVETHLSSSRIFTRISWNSSRLTEGCKK